MRLAKIAYLSAGLLTMAGSGFGYLCLRRPCMAPAPGVRVPRSEARVARGRYVYTVAACDACHSQRDFSRYAGPVIETGRGRGNVIPIAGLPGTVVAPNITPDLETGIGSWTDGEKIRAIRDGVDRHGRALYPMMPYQSYRAMSDDDVQALVAFLDTLPPLRNPLPATLIDFTASLFVKGVPEPAGEVPPPDRRNPQNYGKYLATIAGCADCHTPKQAGRPDTTRAFAGGTTIELGGGLRSVSANITPDPETGIGGWDFERFASLFRSAGAGSGFTMMPWLNYAQMCDEDLEAIFIYLRSVPPVANHVGRNERLSPDGIAANRTSNPESR